MSKKAEVFKPPEHLFGRCPLRVLEIIRAIPRGKVLTYGQVAALADAPRAARQVGRILYFYGVYVPWQRVVNAYGGLSTYKVGSGERQRILLEREGVVFRSDGTLDLKHYLWRPTLRQMQRWNLPEEIAVRLDALLPFSPFGTRRGKNGSSFASLTRARRRTAWVKEKERTSPNHAEKEKGNVPHEQVLLGDFFHWSVDASSDGLDDRAR